jgi:rare lipoprotein A (peptidoglycan hydrolase)
MQTTTGLKLFCISAFLAIFFVTSARTSVEAMSTQRAGFSGFRTPGAMLQPGSAVRAPQKMWAIASWYGKKFQGRRTSSGERFDLRKLTAAHKSLPLGSLVKLTSPTTGKSVVVRINDRGPWLKGRDFDLSEAAATRLGMHEEGVAAVEMALVK